MNTAYCAIGNRSFLASYINRAVSEDAQALATKERDIQAELSKSLTIGQHHIQMFRALYEAYEGASDDNWDGYGAKAIDRNAYIEAMRFAMMLPQTITFPEIDVEPDGELVFEWYRAPRKVFSVIVTSNNEVIYSGLFGTGKVNGTEYFGDELPRTILDNLQRLFS